MSKIPLIMDVDTGSDDAVALILAHLSGRFDLLGVTTVFGSAGVEETTLHTLQTLELLGSPAPVYSGCHEPLARRLYDEGDPIGAGENRRAAPDGTVIGFHEVFDLPQPQRKAEQKNAVTFLVETLRTAPQPVTIIATGALTNLTCAWLLAPEVFANIHRLIVMGGGIALSNKTAAAEGNFFRDPEAARMILASGVDLTLVPLDATHSAALEPQDLERIRAVDNPLAQFTAQVVETRMAAYKALQPLDGQLAVLHDPACVLLALDEKVAAQTHRCQATVSIDHGESAGALLLDRRFSAQDQGNLLAVTRLDKERFLADLLTLLQTPL